jgi:hypothetical protein
MVAHMVLDYSRAFSGVKADQAEEVPLGEAQKTFLPGLERCLALPVEVASVLAAAGFDRPT